MADDDGGKAKGFTVQDRRRFTDTGEAREDAEDTKVSHETRATTGSAPAASSEQSGGEAAQQSEPLPEINFSTFVISLSTQALMHLGEIPNPANGIIEKDFPVAKQMIDIVAMLRDKTRGNLSSNEDKLIVDILFDLRMRYVEAVKQQK